MKRGRQSLDIAMRSRRFAGHDLDFCRRVARNLARSLQRLHEQDIIHCDVKPRNVLLAGDDAEVMLCDLDASARKGSIRTVGPLCAQLSPSHCSSRSRAHKLTFFLLSPQPADKMPSSGYSAPELQRWKIWHDLPVDQRRGKVEVRVSELLDVWGFGVVLFQLCTGEVLFEQNVADDEIVRPLDEMRK